MKSDAGTPDEHHRAAEAFTQTHWSRIRRAQEDSPTSLNFLFHRYRAPLLAHIRRKWASISQDPEDIVQDFFAALLRRGFLKSVNAREGKFRSFLLNSLENHLCDMLDKANALKRGGGLIPNSLDQTDEEGRRICEPTSPTFSPDVEYDRAWATAVLDHALERLRAEYGETHAGLCTALEPVLFADETSPSHADLAGQLNMKEGAVRVAAHRMRRRLREFIRDEILQTVASKEDLEEELRHFSTLFG